VVPPVVPPAVVPPVVPGEKSLLDKASEEAAAAEKAKTDAAAAAARVAPEKYELKAPEGMTLDEALVGAFTPIAKELKLSNEDAQKLTDLYATHQTVLAEKAASDAKAAREAEEAETVKALGADHAVQMTAAAKARDRFFSAATIERINKAGLGNNLGFIQDCIKLGKLISEDKLIEGETKPAAESTAQAMFPSMPNK
jgi:hypothetical protein